MIKWIKLLISRLCVRLFLTFNFAIYAWIGAADIVSALVLTIFGSAFDVYRYLLEVSLKDQYVVPISSRKTIDKLAIYLWKVSSFPILYLIVLAIVEPLFRGEAMDSYFSFFDPLYSLFSHVLAPLRDYPAQLLGTGYEERAGYLLHVNMVCYVSVWAICTYYITLHADSDARYISEHELQIGHENNDPHYFKRAFYSILPPFLIIAVAQYVSIEFDGLGVRRNNAHVNNWNTVFIMQICILFFTALITISYVFFRCCLEEGKRR